MPKYSKNQERVLLKLHALGGYRRWTASELHKAAGFEGRSNATGSALKGLYKRGMVQLFLTSPRSYCLTDKGIYEAQNILRGTEDEPSV